MRASGYILRAETRCLLSGSADGWMYMCVCVCVRAWLPAGVFRYL